MLNSRTSGSTPYVLVVDDFPDGREMTAQYLRFRGLRVKASSNGPSAIRAAREELPGLILLDLAMPGLDGCAVARDLKANPKTADVIVVALSARVLDPGPSDALAAGCDAFIAKPFDIARLGDLAVQLMTEGRPALSQLTDASIQPVP